MASITSLTCQYLHGWDSMKVLRSTRYTLSVTLANHMKKQVLCSLWLSGPHNLQVKMAHRCLYTMWMRAINAELTSPKPYRNRLEWMVTHLEKSIAAEKMVNEFSRNLIDELAADLD